MKGTLHWVSAEHALEAEVRNYGHLFTHPVPGEGTEDGDFRHHIDPDSLEVLGNCKLEPGVAGAEPGSRFQFERLGYYCVDTRDSRPDRPVFNRTVGLRDTWGKMQKKG